MPSRPSKVCAHAGCFVPTQDKSGLCDRHRLVRDERNQRESKQRQAELDKRRGSSSSRGYGLAWRRLRDSVLRDEPLCRECMKRGRVVSATDVDHITPKSLGGTDDRSNLQPLCHSCHSKKTSLENEHRWKYASR